MFSFKQFTIRQDRAAMKVCTDACVLGAYADVANAGFTATTEPGMRILDIGTGTGLLALMAVQRNPHALVDAVEVDDAAFEQAVDNVAASPFAARIRVVHQRIQDFTSTGVLYDRILTNPPFYTNHLRSPDSALNRALHTDDLPFLELVEAVNRLLKPEGQWWVLLPPPETGKLTELAGKAGLRPFHQLALRHHAHKPVFRLITGFSFKSTSLVNETLDIHDADGRAYTAAFRSLLRDFYLIF
ncbi:methyltransferase [Spirosoma agri]